MHCACRWVDAGLDRVGGENGHPHSPGRRELGWCGWQFGCTKHHYSYYPMPETSQELVFLPPRIRRRPRACCSTVANVERKSEDRHNVKMDLGDTGALLGYSLLRVDNQL